MIFGMCSRFCFSLPYFSNAGPSIEMPNEVSGKRQPSLLISSRRIRASSLGSPPPPYSFGHSGTVQPRSAILSSHTRCASFLNFQCRPPQHTSPSSATGWRISGGQFASSHARVSRRKLSSWSSGFSCADMVDVSSAVFDRSLDLWGSSAAGHDAEPRRCKFFGVLAIQQGARISGVALQAARVNALRNRGHAEARERQEERPIRNVRAT
jgi:hypothetical protein